MAALEAGTFKPVEVIMHPVPSGRGNEDGSPLEYSEAPIELNAEDSAFIQRRLRQSLSRYARPVVEDKDVASQVPGMVRELLASSESLIEHSRVIARDLYLKQKWSSPGGLVMTVIGEHAATRCVVIAKMEHQEGMRVEQTKNAEGRRTYKAEHLKDLILGDGTRVFKLGLFTASDQDLLDGHVVDDQQGFGGVADYFIEFLGCQFRQKPDVVTEKFFKTAQTFITNRSQNDPEKNATYEIALLSEMQSSSTAIQPEQFAANHLEEDDQDLFLQNLRDAGVPTNTFPKDTTLVKSKIRRMRISTERGADVFAPPEMHADGSVAIENSADGGSLITVRDNVKRISGASGKRPD
ncbi:nucleoid-associated protein [Mycolicibacterium sp. PAM1]|uniref:nucleoid-associated protein n=1 Tax=Mycolicibacterium sp. PAM1 TaxID=2853535 RepID=UPI001C3C7D19|nr:nucleoid-associated protein [Mycolicibacterium sp. PAM1]MBV5244374.1 nucleoid-associated protein [Mycolicibacterium sp. PAM1]